MATNLTIVDRGRFSIGVTSILHPDAASAIAPDGMEGLELRDPESVLQDLVPRMRESGADITVVLLHASRERAHAEGRKLATSVRGIDVLVTSEVLGESETRPRPEESFPGGYLVSPETRTYLVEGNSGHRRVIAAELQLERQPDRPWRVRGIDTRHISPAEMSAQPKTASRLEELVGRFLLGVGAAGPPEGPTGDALGARGFHDLLAQRHALYQPLRDRAVQRRCATESRPLPDHRVAHTRGRLRGDSLQ